jgi:hypothetical protein
VAPITAIAAGRDILLIYSRDRPSFIGLNRIMIEFQLTLYVGRRMGMTNFRS